MKKKQMPPSSKGIRFEKSEDDEKVMEGLLDENLSPSSSSESPLLEETPGKSDSAPKHEKPDSAPRPEKSDSASESGRDVMESIMHFSIPTIKDADVEPLPSLPTKNTNRKRPPTRLPDDFLDLHGKTREEALVMVHNFIELAYQQRLRHVLIITGWGKHSGQGGPILRRTVWEWLKKNGGRYARDFASAPSEHGGEGAIWINLL